MSKKKKDMPGNRIRFEIESLGPIRDSVVEFKPFMLFSGPSNTGKSYTALCVYFLFYMLGNKGIGSELLKIFDIEAIKKELKEGRSVDIPFPAQFNAEIERLYNEKVSRFMGSMLGIDEFQCKVKLILDIPGLENGRIRFTGNKDKTVYFPEIETSTDIFTWVSQAGSPSPEPLKNMEFWVLHLSEKILFDKSLLGSFLLPPARGAFSGFTYSGHEEFSGIGMYKEFLRGIDRVRYLNFEPDDDLEIQRKEVNQIFVKLLGGKIRTERNKISYTLTGSGADIPLSGTSASVKELFSLYLILNRESIDNVSICIEEPEAHLHPELQRSAALLLAYIVNKGGFIQATTHSDFFVNQINNLLKLHHIKTKKPGQLQQLLKETGLREDCILNPDDIGAYYFPKENGAVKVTPLEKSENGFALSSFKQTYDQSINETRTLREALADDED